MSDPGSKDDKDDKAGQSTRALSWLDESPNADGYVATLGKKLRSQAPASPMVSEVTMVDREEALDAPTTAPGGEARSEDTAPPCFEVLQGADKDKLFVINSGLTLLGRGIDNDIILADVAVSRKHSQIHWDGAVVRYKDLGSGNGTRLNGAKITEAELKEGDRLELGETVLVFRVTSEHIKPRRLQTPPAIHSRTRVGGATEAGENLQIQLPVAVTTVAPHGVLMPPTSAQGLTGALAERSQWATRADTTSSVLVPRSLLVAGLCAGLILATLVGALGTWLWVKNGQQASATRYQGVNAKAQQESVRAGIEAFDALAWDRAERFFHEVLVREPTNIQAANYLERIRDAREHELAIASAEKLLSQGQFNKAHNTLSGVTTDSPLAAKAATLRQRIVRQWVQSDMEQAERASSKGDHSAARAYAEHALRIDPQSEDARLFLQGWNKSRSQTDVGEDLESFDRKGNDAATSGTSAQRKALTAYREGSFSDAATWMRRAALMGSSAQRTILEQRADEIDRFATLYGRIKSGAAPETLIAQLRSATQLDASISGGVYASQLKSLLLSGYLKLYQRASVNGVTLVGCQHLQHIHSLDKNNKQIKKDLSSCQRLVEKLYRGAKDIFKTDPARAKATYSEIVTAADPSSSLFHEIERSLRETTD